MIFKKIKQKLNCRPGQGLVELIVAIAVIEVGLFSVWSLFLINFNTEREAELRIVGVNLAREGIEVVKNIRDSNWLKRSLNQPINKSIWTWDQGLDSGSYSINFDSLTLEDVKFKKVFINEDGFFTNLESASPSPFSRVIHIKDICCNDAEGDLKCDDVNFFLSDGESVCGLRVGLNVVSEVTWVMSGKNRQAIIEDNLYDWQ